VSERLLFIIKYASSTRLFFSTKLFTQFYECQHLLTCKKNTCMTR
jgi:hypothetical protein